MFCNELSEKEHLLWSHFDKLSANCCCEAHWVRGDDAHTKIKMEGQCYLYLRFFESGSVILPFKQYKHSVDMWFGSHGGQDDNVGLLACNAIQVCS